VFSLRRNVSNGSLRRGEKRDFNGEKGTGRNVGQDQSIGLPRTPLPTREETALR